MRPPEIPPDEELRLHALHCLELLDSESEERFDRLTRLAARALKAPIVAISLIDEDREWFKSSIGIEASEAPRANSFCGHAILSDATLVVADTRADERFADNPAVAAPDGVRFYAGHPIEAQDGSRIGVLCIKGYEPRDFSLPEVELLRDLAGMVESELRLSEVTGLRQRLRLSSEAERRTRARQDHFFALSLDMLCIAGFDGYFKRLNPAWEKILGYPRDELLAEPFVGFVHPDDREATLREASRIAEGATSVSFENRYRAKSGEYRWLHWTAAPAVEDERIYAVARDITEEKLRAAALESARDAAEAANRAKSEFLANMSHELRTPLNSVIGFAGVLLRDRAAALGDTGAHYLRRIQVNGRHLLSLINQVLDLSKIEAGRLDLDLSEIRLEGVIAEIIAQFEGQTRDLGLELCSEIPRRVEPLRADQGKLAQVLINLIGNAVKFTDEGRVTVRVRTGDDDIVESIEVTDTGVGIPADRLGTIFESFEQVDSSPTRRHQGTGLGLTISRSLCNLMGYRLEAESRQAEGSTFRIVLPPAADGATAAEVTSERPVDAVLVEGSDGLRERLVLVIDDDADSRSLIAHHLHDLGCQVLTTASGEQGIDLARQHQPDLITLDLMMPGTDGWQVLRQLKGDPDLGGIPVVVVSVVASENQGELWGVVDILDKPISGTALRRVMAHSLSGDQERAPRAGDGDDR